MPNNYTDTNVSDLIFNVLDSATYEDLSTNNQLNNNQLYFITDDEGYKIKQSVITDNVGISDSTNTSNRFVYSYSQTADGVISTKTRSLSPATSAEIGGIQIGYTKDGTKYPVELDNNNKAYVNVPIQDGVTYTFTNGTDGSFSVKPSNGNTTQKVLIGKPATAGAADTAGAFSSGTTVTLTGVVTGTSDSSTKGWSVPTTIGNGVITNDMLTNSSFRIGNTDISLGNSFTASSFKRLLGLDAAMRFIGKAVNTIRDGYSDDPGIGGYDIDEAQAGDIVIDSSNSYEYIWTTEGKWERLGPDSNYKVVQSAVSSPNASGNATAFIDTISQNANGEITVTKKNLNTSGIWSGKANTAGTADIANSVEWDNVANKPSSFTPAAHTHGNITNTGDITVAAPTIANGDQLVINDHSASKITNGPTFDGETVSKALTPKGTWETFLTSHQSVSNKDATLSWGTATNIATIGTTNINVTLPNNPNTDNKLSTAAVTNGTTYYPIVGTNTTDASTKFYDANGFTYTSTSDAAKLTLGNNIASGTNDKQGQLVLYGTTAYATTITPGAPTEARAITLPNKDGTVALTSDIPTAYTLTQATSNALGGIKIGYSESGKNYAIKLNNDGQAYVSVPWTDNNDNTRYEFNTSAQENKIQYREIGSSTWIDIPFTPSILNNITGVGNRTANHIAVFNNTNTITDGPAFGTSTTTFLRNDQTWQPLPVTSVAGKSLTSGTERSSDVQLGTLTIGGKEYDGSGDITISLEDLNIASTTTMLGITDTPIDEDDPNTSTNPQINLVVPASGPTIAVDSNIVMRQDTGEEFVWLSGAWHKMGVASSYALEHHIHGNITSGGAITSDTAITNDSRLVITDGNNKITRVVGTLKFDTSQTGKALSQAGTWIDVNNYTLPTASASVLGGIKVGSGLSISNGILSHTDASSQASITASGRRYITGVTLDTYGHVTGLTTGTETVTDTRNTAGATDTSDKIYLIGAKTQAENPQTYSDDEVYATSGVLTAKTFNSTSLTASQAVSTDANKNLVSTNLTTTDPTASGNGIIYIASISQNAVGKITATKSTVRDATDSQSGVVNTGAQTFAGNKTFNNNIIFADANVGVQRAGRSVQWIDGRDGALVKTTSINTSGYSPIISTKTTDGSWEIGAYDNANYLNDLVFTYCTDENYDADTNTTTAQIKFQEDGSIVAKLIGDVTGDLTGNADSATSANINTDINAVAYYTDAAGTFGSKASTNGALYATSANGALQWGTLPVGQGGTGNTEFTANRLIFSESAAKLSASGHYASSNKIAINSTTAPTQNLYVNGTSYIQAASAVGTTVGLTINNGLLAITNNGNTVKIGSANSSYMHFTNTANIPFYFDHAVHVNGNLTPYGTTNTQQLGTSSNRWKLLEIGTASSYGGTAKPIYWNNGVPTAITATVGTTTQPVYLSSGTITATTATVGATNKPIYMSSGTITASNATVGTTYNPTYMNAGTITATSGYTVEYIKGTQTATTGSWTGVTKDAALYDGKMIMYVLPYAGSGNATLNLTLSGGTTTGAKNIYRYGNTTAITTHYAAGSRILLIYDATNDRWNSSAWYDSSNAGQRTWRSSTNIELPIAGISTVSSATAAYAAITSGSYKDVYAAIPEDTTKVATLNPSTGTISATTFVPLNSYIELNNIGLRDTELGYVIEFNEEFGRVGHFDTLFADDTEISSITISRVTQTATTTSANYEVLFSATADNTTRTEGARKNSNLTFNPSSGRLNSTSFIAASNGSFYLDGWLWDNSGFGHEEYDYIIEWASGTSGPIVRAEKVYGAVWNDYAEFRQSDQNEPGRVVIEKGDDILTLSTERLQPGAEIISDTYGFAIGETNNCKTPIAASGRVLAYPFEDRDLFKQYIGAPVCSGPNGTVSIMTEEEEQKYPSRIIGIVSAVPDYEEWGTGKVKVNGRVWIRIR